jgi:hypothetical protein
MSHLGNVYLQSKIGKDCYVHNFLFTNDQVAITQEVKDANYMGRKTEDNETQGLNINYGNTEYLSRNPLNELEINGSKIKTVNNFKYLG